MAEFKDVEKLSEAERNTLIAQAKVEVMPFAEDLRQATKKYFKFAHDLSVTYHDQIKNEHISLLTEKHTEKLASLKDATDIKNENLRHEILLRRYQDAMPGELWFDVYREGVDRRKSTFLAESDERELIELNTKRLTLHERAEKTINGLMNTNGFDVERYTEGNSPLMTKQEIMANKNNRDFVTELMRDIVDFEKNFHEQVSPPIAQPNAGNLPKRGSPQR